MSIGVSNALGADSWERLKQLLDVAGRRVDDGVGDGHGGASGAEVVGRSRSSQLAAPPTPGLANAMFKMDRGVRQSPALPLNPLQRAEDSSRKCAVQRGEPSNVLREEPKSEASPVFRPTDALSRRDQLETWQSK